MAQNNHNATNTADPEKVRKLVKEAKGSKSFKQFAQDCNYIRSESYLCKICNGQIPVPLDMAVISAIAKSIDDKQAGTDMFNKLLEANGYNLTPCIAKDQIVEQNLQNNDPDNYPLRQSDFTDDLDFYTSMLVESRKSVDFWSKASDHLFYLLKQIEVNKVLTDNETDDFIDSFKELLIAGRNICAKASTKSRNNCFLFQHIIDRVISDDIEHL